MTSSALTLMLGVWAVIFLATGACFWKLLTSERQFGGQEED